MKEPENREHVARILALLDAAKACQYGHSNAVTLGLHEQEDAPFALEVADWCKRNGLHIDHYATARDGVTYEVWNIDLDPGRIAVWPTKIGLLDGKDELRNKIEAIRKAADEQIQQLLEVERAKA